MTVKKCLFCSCEYSKKYNESKAAFSAKKFCSRECSDKDKVGKKHSYEHCEKIRMAGLGRKHTQASKLKMSGQNSHKWKGGKPRCIDCGNELKNIKARRCYPCWVKQATGKNASHWMGGKTPENLKIRNSTLALEWRKSIFERDGFTCQSCGQIGGDLQAHHLIPFAVDKDRRFDLNNGQTLCKTCHRKVHTGPKSLRIPHAVMKAVAA